MITALGGVIIVLVKVMSLRKNRAAEADKTRADAAKVEAEAHEVEVGCRRTRSGNGTRFAKRCD